MKSSTECLALAAQMDARAAQSANEAAQKAYRVMAVDWRRTAILALQHEHWTASHQVLAA